MVAKGILVMVVQDQEGHFSDFQLKKMDTQTVRAELAPPISPDVVLCSDGTWVYASFSQSQEVTYQVVRERTSPSAERVNETLPWGSSPLPEGLSRVGLGCRSVMGMEWVLGIVCIRHRGTPCNT